MTVLDGDGTELPAVVSEDGHLVSWRAADVGSLGWRTYRVIPSDEADGWKPLRATRSATNITGCGSTRPAVAGWCRWSTSATTSS